MSLYLISMVSQFHQKQYTPSSDTWIFPKRGRKKKPRQVNYTPTLTIREPIEGAQHDDIIFLGHDELETLRLKNISGLGVIDWAQRMGISKSLFANIYKQATKKITKALIHGKSLHIELWGQWDELDSWFTQPLL
jgi:predicted DNA-binding protein (UPF0251 family)